MILWYYCRRRFLTSCWVNFTSTSMLQILNKIKNNMIKLWSQSMIKNLRLHLVACYRNQWFALHVISCSITRHFMHHFTSFYVTFCIISCHISYISSYTSHTSHAHHACRAFRISPTARISCIAPYIASFYVSFHIMLS